MREAVALLKLLTNFRVCELNEFSFLAAYYKIFDDACELLSVIGQPFGLPMEALIAKLMTSFILNHIANPSSSRKKR